jgi:uncharacterized protein YjiS (DUF1127 family)
MHATAPNLLASAGGTGLFARTVDLLLGWHLRARSRATLAELDDRLLADLGLSRADVVRECDKPFWR